MNERYLTSFEDQTTVLDYTSGDTTLASPQVSLVCADEVVYSKGIPNESKIITDFTYGYIDLGLPSGIIWSDRNVGAENPWDNGLYFSWGNVDGHTVDENGNVTDKYSFESSIYSTTSGDQYTGSTLDSEHDAATVNMGNDWRMPTSAETVELIQETDHYYIGEDGSVVAKSELNDTIRLRSICFVKKGETFNYNVRSNFIEFPFAANCFGSLLGSDGFYGYVWSSSVDERHADEVRYLYFDSNGYLYGDNCSSRWYGQSVRGVRA